MTQEERETLAAALLVFSLLHTFLLRPLPCGDASRLAVVYEHTASSLTGWRDLGSKSLRRGHTV